MHVDRKVFFRKMKKLAKKLLMAWWATLYRDKGPKVIYYHDIGNEYTAMGTPQPLFQEHVRYARAKGWSFVKGLPIHDKELQICFDDGFRGIFEARDYFLEEELCPTVFIAVDLVGKPGHLTWDEICALQKDGFVFESHTWSHQTLAGAFIEESPMAERTGAWFLHELRDSSEEIGRRLGRKVSALCFPAGHFSDDVIRRCEAAGYTTLYSSVPGRMDGESEKWKVNSSCQIVPRNLVQSADPASFGWILDGALMPLRKRYFKQHWSPS